ncbi:hypothetical protein RND71_018577 [Anisodus tanguticus]|uniref:MSP domain-containing protein n=1 Tax=Anisodus tanguticus TaxID=243964 RepID=A0AAE1S6E5_9SOLA|nr:hypothetical protein RND71_018577 [Anisodus tanguticus]
MSAGATNQLISVSPPELKFLFELDKQSYCDLKVTNSTENCVAFKVKTTSPKKYFVRPNTGIVQPWDSCFIQVGLQAQKESPPDMQCKEKFLLQRTIVNNDIGELPPDTDGGRTVEECKLRVVYTSSNSSPGHSEDVFRQSSDFTSNQALQRIKDERDAAVRQTQQLLQELEMMKRRSSRNDPGFSLRFAIVVGVIGLLVGFLLKLLSSPAVE